MVTDFLYSCSRQMKNMRLMLAVGVSAILFALAMPVAAQAAGSVSVSTKYPGITAAPGETVTFPLELKNNSSRDAVISLSLDSAPEKWTALFKGNGREISKAYVDAGSFSSAQLEVTIPNDAAAGEYSLAVTGTNIAGLSHQLQLEVQVDPADTGGDELSAQYSELKGPSGATFNFKLDLINHGNTAQLYSLGAQTPPGWQVSFKPSYEQQQVASINVDAGKTQGLDVTVTTPPNVAAGGYSIPVHAVSAGGKAKTELKVIITGTYDLELSTPSGRLNAEVTAGGEQKVNLTVNNTGSSDLNNISFSSREPRNWSVSFTPETIDSLPAGESRQVTAVISADSKAIAGDYVVSMTASNQEVSSSADFRVTVNTSTLWGLVGLVIILLVIGAVYWTFRTYGRR